MIFNSDPSEIKSLDSTQLVNLLRMLLFSESRLLGIPLRAVDIPLQITVPDGGEDGRIQWQSEVKETGFLPSKVCIFQVKVRGKFGKPEIRRELLKTDKGPKTLNDAIMEVVDFDAHYIIFCSLPFVSSKIKLLKNSVCDLIREFGREVSVEKIHIYDANKISGGVTRILLWHFG